MISSTLNTKDYIVESLQSQCIHPPVCFPLWGTQVQSPGGYLCETGILLLALSRYIDDPNIQHDWSLWPHLRQASSRTVTRPSCRQCDNPTWSHTAFLSRFHAHCRSSFRLHKHIVGCWGGGGALWRACNLTAFIQSSTGPVVYPFASHHEGPEFNPQGLLIWNRDSPVRVVSLQHHDLMDFTDDVKHFYTRNLINSAFWLRLSFLCTNSNFNCKLPKLIKP